MHPIALWPHAGRHDHHQPREPVAKDTEVQHLDVARAEVVHHLQVPDHEKEHHSLHQHPEEAGEEKVVKKARDDGAAGLERRSTCTQDPHLDPRQGADAEEEGRGGPSLLSIPQTQSIHSLHNDLWRYSSQQVFFGKIDNCRGLLGT